MQFITRRAGAVLAAVALTVTMAACSGDDPDTVGTEEPSVSAPSDSPEASPTPSPSATPDAEPTVLTDLDSITVTGELNQPVTVEVPAPMKVDETIVKVLSAGDGATVPEGGQVRVFYTGVNGRTAEEFDASWQRGEEPTAFNLNEVVPGFAKALAGQKVGSRILVAMSGADAYDPIGGRPPAILVGDTLVFVIDIAETQLAGPEGDPVTPTAGLPTVGGPLDAPVVTVPKTDPPTELVVQTLIKGKGAELAATDTMVGHYQTVSWKTGEVIDQSYGRTPPSGQISRLIEGWKQGLPGQTVGSRVLLVVPPELAYGEDGYEDPPVEPGDTLVYVIDILMATPAE